MLVKENGKYYKINDNKAKVELDLYAAFDEIIIEIIDEDSNTSSNDIKNSFQNYSALLTDILSHYQDIELADRLNYFRENIFLGNHIEYTEAIFSAVINRLNPLLEKKSISAYKYLLEFYRYDAFRAYLQLDSAKYDYFMDLSLKKLHISANDFHQNVIEYTHLGGGNNSKGSIDFRALEIFHILCTRLKEFVENETTDLDIINYFKIDSLYEELVALIPYDINDSLDSTMVSELKKILKTADSTYKWSVGGNKVLSDNLIWIASLMLYHKKQFIKYHKRLEDLAIIYDASDNVNFKYYDIRNTLIKGLFIFITAFFLVTNALLLINDFLTSHPDFLINIVFRIIAIVVFIIFGYFSYISPSKPKMPDYSEKYRSLQQKYYYQYHKHIGDIVCGVVTKEQYNALKREAGYYVPY